MSDEPSQEFHVCASLRRKSQAEKVVQKEGCFGLSLTVSLHRNAHVLLGDGVMRTIIVQWWEREEKRNYTVIDRI